MSNQSKRKARRGTASPFAGPASVQPAPPDTLTAIASAVLLLVTAALAAYVRLRLADVPLERDEGEYAYADQLILEGTPTY